jgi:chromosome partitioning protein
MTRLAHSMADTLVTPLNDSFVDFDVLATIDPQTFAVTGTSHYSEMVREARRQPRLVDGNAIDWVVVRNRLSVLGSRNRELIAQGAHELAGRLGFRFVDGLAERIIYREFFPRGLSALDDLSEQTLGIAPGGAHGKARQEVEALVAALKLPIDERGRRRAAARAEWRASADTPLALHDVLAG